MPDSSATLTIQIAQTIISLRGQKIMLSHDLAALYGVETRALVQAVKRNLKRFPLDFMFQLDLMEWSNLKSHFVTSRWGGARRSIPYALMK